MQSIQPTLWFDGVAEEAARFYVDALGGRLGAVTRYGPEGPGPAGSVMTVDFEVRGQWFTGLNGGPQFPFTEAVSFAVACAGQAEIDRVWDALVDGGEPGMCGWLKDRFGLSWQVVPTDWYEMATSDDGEALARASRVVLSTRGKFDLAAIRAAYEGREPAADG